MEIDNYYSMIESLHEKAQDMLNRDIPRSQEIAAKQVTHVNQQNSYILA